MYSTINNDPTVNGVTENNLVLQFVNQNDLSKGWKAEKKNDSFTRADTIIDAFQLLYSKWRKNIFCTNFLAKKI